MAEQAKGKGAAAVGAISTLYDSLAHKVTATAAEVATAAKEHTLDRLKRVNSEGGGGYRKDRKGRMIHTDDDAHLSVYAKQKLGPHHAEQKARRQQIRSAHRWRQGLLIGGVVLGIVACFFIVDCAMKHRFRAYKYVHSIRGNDVSQE